MSGDADDDGIGDADADEQEDLHIPADHEITDDDEDDGYEDGGDAVPMGGVVEVNNTSWKRVAAIGQDPREETDRFEFQAHLMSSSPYHPSCYTSGSKHEHQRSGD